MTNVCIHAAIYGIDGTPWVTSSDWPGLKEYEFQVEQEDGSFQPCKVNEWYCVQKATAGDRKPCPAGIRFINTKFMFIKSEEGTTYLSKQGGGGACLSRTKNAILIGVWDKNAVMSNNTPQNSGDCNGQVEKVAKFLKEQGY